MRHNCLHCLLTQVRRKKDKQKEILARRLLTIKAVRLPRQSHASSHYVHDHVVLRYKWDIISLTRWCMLFRECPVQGAVLWWGAVMGVMQPIEIQCRGVLVLTACPGADPHGRDDSGARPGHEGPADAQVH